MTRSNPLVRCSAVLVCVLFIALATGCQHTAPTVQGSSGPDSAGAGQDAIDKIVGQTKMVASATNKQIYFKAPQYGSIYLYDATDGNFIYRGFLDKGEAFLFEPASSRAQINKQTVDLERFTNERDEYQLYFTPR